MEFELAGDFGHYDLKESNAAKFSNQLLTFSTFLCVVLVIMFIVSIVYNGGFAPLSENPMYGPSTYTLIELGAKVDAFIVYRHQGWRLFSSLFLHAGIFHLLPNVLIQLLCGGYLNLAYGNLQFSSVFFASGIFGNMLSCVALPDSVSVGSSGALMGLLTSWVVWIVFRWNKVPVIARKHRNCQLFAVIVCIAITIASSFHGYVDWAAHVGGGIQGISRFPSSAPFFTVLGFLFALIMLSSELDNIRTRAVVRITAGTTSFALFFWAACYIAVLSKPNPSILYYQSK